jgi:beta-phosphoglucomutase-like phosphatase (HAD superfamily)
MSVLKALIFDVDGTLAETERDGHRIAFNRAFEDAGLGWHWSVEHYGELLAVTGGKERIAHHWQAVDPRAAAAPDAAERVRALHAAKTAHYLELVRSGTVVLRPGVRRLLIEARARGLRLAIATTTTEANVRELLTATISPLAPGWFEVMGAGDVVARKKPAPDIYRWVLDRLRLPADECLAIEDSAPGVAAARAAGLATLLTRSVYSSGETITGALADLDGLGTHPDPANGLVPTAEGMRPWSGVVDVNTLRAWHTTQSPDHSSQRQLQNELRPALR